MISKSNYFDVTNPTRYCLYDRVTGKMKTYIKIK